MTPNFTMIHVAGVLFATAVFGFIRLRQNTLQLAAGMNGEATAPQLIKRRRVGFGAIPLDSLQFTAGRFIW